MDKKEALKIVQENGSELSNLPDHFKKDKQIVLEAVKQYGLALYHADRSLRKDKEVVLEAIKGNGGALEVADKSLKKDKLFILHDPAILLEDYAEKKFNKIPNFDFKDNKIIVGIGRLTKQKKHILLIKLFSILKEKKKNIFLYILGDGEEKNNLLQEIKKLNLQDKIFLLGFKKNVYPSNCMC